MDKLIDKIKAIKLYVGFILDSLYTIKSIFVGFKVDKAKGFGDNF